MRPVVRVAEGVAVWLEEGVTVWLEEGVAVWLDEGVAVWLEEGVAVWLEEDVAVRLEEGVAVWLEEGVAVWLIVGVAVDVGVIKGNLTSQGLLMPDRASAGTLVWPEEESPQQVTPWSADNAHTCPQPDATKIWLKVAEAGTFVWP